VLLDFCFVGFLSFVQGEFKNEAVNCMLLSVEGFVTGAALNVGADFNNIP